MYVPSERPVRDVGLLCLHRLRELLEVLDRDLGQSHPAQLGKATEVRDYAPGSCDDRRVFCDLVRQVSVI